MSECEKFEERLNEALDLRQSPREHQALRDHCSQCAECRQVLDTYFRMLEGVAGLSLPMPAPELAERIITRFGAARSTRRRRVRVLGSLAAAAALFVAAFLGLRSLDAGRESGSKSSVAAVSGSERIDESANVPQAEESNTNDPSFAEQHSGRAGTTEISQSDVTSPEDDADVDLLFFGILPGSKSSDGSGSTTDWVTAMNQGLKPLSDSTSGALDQLTDAFPFDEDSGF